MRPHVALAQGDRQAQGLAQPLHGAGVFFCLSPAAQHMVEMGQGRLDSQSFSQPGQDDGQGSGVRPPRDAHHHPLPTMEDAFPPDEEQQPLLQRSREAGAGCQRQPQGTICPTHSKNMGGDQAAAHILSLFRPMVG